jgi:hypothetical protein
MKKYLKTNWPLLLACIIIVPAFTCYGCRTAKITDTAATGLRDNSRLDVVQTRSSHESLSVAATTDAAETETTTTETTTTIYDTDKPVDATTGKPPVKSETTIRKVMERGKTEQMLRLESAERTAHDSLSDRTKNDLLLTVETQHTETPKTPAIAYWWYIVATLAVIAAGWFLNKNFGWTGKIAALFK